MKNFLICIFSFSLLISCFDKTNKEDDCLTYIKSDNPESLTFWTADTILKTNCQLVQLMDALYQYVRDDSFPSESLKDEIERMGRYRLKLCKYYDTKYPSTDSISSLEKADSVISEARALWSIDNDYSTMGMIIHNDTERTRLIFEQFNEYDKLRSICETEEQKVLYNISFL